MRTHTTAAAHAKQLSKAEIDALAEQVRQGNRVTQEELDAVIEATCRQMVADGEPVSRPALQKKLGLKSRGTLATEKRKQLIQQFETQQLPEITRKKLSLEEKCERLEAERDAAIRDRDYQIQLVAMITANARAKNYDLGELLKPLQMATRQVLGGKKRSRKS